MNLKMDLEQEQDLVEKAKHDSGAFGTLYDLHYSEIFSYALRRSADVHVAQDITSEVFFRALKSIARFRWQGISFSAWLYRIANNETANYFRHSHNGQLSWDDQSEFAAESSSPEEELLQAEAELKRHEQYLAVHANIVKLGSRYQEVIALRFFQDKQINEIAQILGKSEGTVKSLLHRGLKKLKLSMEQCNLFRRVEL
jgi:RNA polymerase sigma-70 factor (ECF subfamily)